MATPFTATRPWKIYGEGPTKVAAGSFHDTDTASYTAEDFRFTTKGNDLYIIELGWPVKNEAVIQSLGATVGAAKIASVTLLGSDAKLNFDKTLMLCAFRFQRRLPGSMPMSSV